jgi:hypothetical protein
MSARKISLFDKALARVCANCPVCRRARHRQRGLAFWLVRQVEIKLCPFCRAYERVYGRRAHVAPASSAPPGPAQTPSILEVNPRVFTKGNKK